MSNMSYCRFTNTKADMEDCLSAMRECDELSDFEAQAGKAMFKSILELCQELNFIDHFDADEIDRVFNSMEEKDLEDE